MTKERRGDQPRSVRAALALVPLPVLVRGALAVAAARGFAARPVSVEALGSRGRELDQRARDAGGLQRVPRVLRQVGGQFDESVVETNVDVAEVLTPQAALVGQGTHDVPRCDAVPLADCDAVGGQWGRVAPLASLGSVWTNGVVAHVLPAGDVRLWVWSPDGTTGKFVLGFGVEEGGQDLGGILSNWSDYAY